MLRIRIFINGKSRWSHSILKTKLQWTIGVIARELAATAKLENYVVVADDGSVFSILWRSK